MESTTAPTSVAEDATKQAFTERINSLINTMGWIV
jgi:hypothetical protein